MNKHKATRAGSHTTTGHRVQVKVDQLRLETEGQLSRPFVGCVSAGTSASNPAAPAAALSEARAGGGRHEKGAP